MPAARAIFRRVVALCPWVVIMSEAAAPSRSRVTRFPRVRLVTLWRHGRLSFLPGYRQAAEDASSLAPPPPPPRTRAALNNRQLRHKEWRDPAE